MPVLQVVIDTNVIVSALRSKRGAAHRLITLLGDERWQANLSVALVLQYEAVGRELVLRREFQRWSWTGDIVNCHLSDQFPEALR
jgi:predicted nucleic acid-binding protein